MIDITSLLAVGAVAWSMIQQFQINAMCSKCPLVPKNQTEKKENNSLVKN